MVTIWIVDADEKYDQNLKPSVNGHQAYQLETASHEVVWQLMKNGEITPEIINILAHNKYEPIYLLFHSNCEANLTSVTLGNRVYAPQYLQPGSKRSTFLLRSSQPLSTVKATRAEKDGYKELIERIPFGVYRTNLKGQLLSANRAFMEMLGFASFEELVAINEGNNWQTKYSRKYFKKLLDREGEVVGLESIWNKRDGTPIIVRESAKVVRDADGAMRYYEGIIEDITQWKKMETDLKRSQQSYIELVNSIDGIVWIADVETFKINFVSEPAERILGYPVKQWLNEPYFWEQHIHPDDREWVIKLCREATLEKRDHWFEYRMIAANGEIKWFRDNVSVTINENNRVQRQGIMIDITESKAAEEQIREQAALLDSTNDAVVLSSLQGQIIFWNKGAEHIFGWTSEEAKEKNIVQIYADQGALMSLNIRKLVLKDGEWHGQLKAITKNGKPIALESHWSIIYDNKKMPKSILTISSDVSERECLKAQFLRVQRLENIGILASGIAHDLNNVLSPMVMSVPMLKRRCTDAWSQTLLGTLETTAKRGVDLVKQVLSFARGIDGNPIPLEVSHIIAEVRKIVSETFPRSIQIICEFSKEPWNILADATQLHQILMNLCVNARDAMPDGGILNISAENLFVDDSYAAMNANIKTGPYVLITVSDTGTGIPSDMLEKIFDPFFSTKDISKGTGLGLSTVKSIISNHGGFINVSSRLSVGTEFKIFLPAVDGLVICEEREKYLEDWKGNGETLLVVDDEDSICTVTKSILEQYNYKVLIASNCAEAISLYQQHMPEIVAIISDIMMPLPDGLTIVRNIEELNANVPIIAVSGIGLDEKISLNDYPNVKAFILKPYTIDILLKALYTIINKEDVARGEEMD